jgi:hypothetical protein
MGRGLAWAKQRTISRFQVARTPIKDQSVQKGSLAWTRRFATSENEAGSLTLLIFA